METGSAKILKLDNVCHIKGAAGDYFKRLQGPQITWNLIAHTKDLDLAGVHWGALAEFE